MDKLQEIKEIVCGFIALGLFWGMCAIGLIMSRGM
jgi:hypothetical protein